MTQKKKEILGTDIKARMNDQDFKINNKNKPRVFANTLTIDKEIVNLVKVYLLYVIIERMINARLGPFKQLK